MKPLRFGIKTAPQHTTYGEMLALWEEADNIPAIEHAWLFDHYAPIHSDVDGPCLEGWTTLAAFAARTKRLRLGLMVTGNTYRHPADQDRDHDRHHLGRAARLRHRGRVE